MASNTVIDKRSLWIVIITSILILMIVVLGLVVKFTLDEGIGRIILIVLICVLSIFGITMLVMLEMRKKTLKKDEQATAIRNNNGYYYNIQPTAPQDTSWEYSKRTTVPA